MKDTYTASCTEQDFTCQVLLDGHTWRGRNSFVDFVLELLANTELTVACTRNACVLESDLNHTSLVQRELLYLPLVVNFGLDNLAVCNLVRGYILDIQNILAQLLYQEVFVVYVSL
jgi:hypothetical protein